MGLALINVRMELSTFWGCLIRQDSQRLNIRLSYTFQKMVEQFFILKKLRISVL